MRILHHPDTTVLEQGLLAALDRRLPFGAIHPARVLVPNTALVDHLQRRLLQHRPAWLGLQVQHFGGLARDLLRRRGAAPFRVLPSSLLEAIVEDCLSRLPEGLWSRFVVSRPGALGRISRALFDLREAGIAPADLEALAGDRRDQDLAALLRLYLAALDELQTQGWLDETGLLKAAAHSLERARLAGEPVWVHGAYELVGSALDLVHALDRVTEVTILLPFGAGLPATRFSEAYAERHLIGKDDTVEALAALSPSDRLPLEALYDEEAEPPAAGDRLRFRHVQGAESEARLATRRALVATAAGTDPGEIAIVARDLTDYASGFEAALDAEGVPWTTSLRAPLRRHPLVHDFLLALRAVDERLPRRAASELLASPWIDWDRLAPDQPTPGGGHAEPWSRASRILGGLDEWRDVLPRWAAVARLHEEMTDDEREAATTDAERRGVEARAMADALGRFHDTLAPERVRRWDRFADDLRDALESLFREPDTESGDRARQELTDLLDQMRALAETGIDPGEVSLTRVRGWLERAVDATRVAPIAGNGSGIRVLDLLQARSMTFDRVIWLGLNAGRFPRPPREDPILGDRLRLALRERTGRPLVVGSERADEERLLLAMTLGSASGAIELSWQRADEDGKARTPSLALREIARLALGRPDLDGVTEPDDHRLPSHPEAWLDALGRETGMLTPSEALLLRALRAGESGVAALERLSGDLEPGLGMLCRTEFFRRIDTVHDGEVGPLDTIAQPHSVTSLETLGRCPLQYLFRVVARVREPDEDVDALAATPREVGLRIHDLLEKLYRHLDDQGILAMAEPQRTGRAVELFRTLWSEGRGPLDPRLRERLPVLWSQQRELWAGALERFLIEDLERIASADMRPTAFEDSTAATLDLGEGVEAAIRGRFDRRLRDTAGDELVGDYKTSGNLETKANVTTMLKGRALQVPLYHLLTGGRTAVELLGVGPKFDPADGAADPKQRRALFGGFADDRQRRGFLETVRVLLDLVERGRYPLNPTGGACDYCAYTAACRRHHPPTVERERSADEVQEFYRLGAKNRTRYPLLADLPGADGATGEADR